MQRAIDLIDKTIDIIGRTIAWLTPGMVVLVVVIVILRYAFQFGSIALQESVTYVNALIFTLGAAYTLKEKGHVRVDIFYSRLTERYKAVVDLIGTLLFLMPSVSQAIVLPMISVVLSIRSIARCMTVGLLNFLLVLLRPLVKRLGAHYCTATLINRIIGRRPESGPQPDPQ
jgi:TRAP-type mannitol/chloroaromatic compound transport system permease small subunit